MEDFKSRLKFNDVSVQSHCIQKLIAVIKKKAKGEILTSASLQIPELNLIWESCTDDASFTSSLAVQAIVLLVENKSISSQLAVNKFLSYVKSARNKCALINGLVDVLLYEFNDTKEDNKFPHYSLHCPKHPLITVLQDSNESWPLILQSIKNVLSSNTRSFEAMKPVICYIFSNPFTKETASYFKILLLDSLFIHFQPEILSYSLQLIPFMQAESFFQVAELSVFVEKLYLLAKSNCDTKQFSSVAQQLLLLALSLTERCLTCGCDSNALLNICEEISRSLVKNNFSHSYSTVNLCLTLLSFILKDSVSVTRQKLITIGLELLKTEKISPTISAFLAVSAIQVLSDPSIVAEKEPLLLLQKLEHIFSPRQMTDDNELGTSTAEGPVVDNFIDMLESFTSLMEITFNCYRFNLKLDSCDLKFKLLWLKSIRESVNCDKKSNFHVIFSIVAALFIMSPEEDSMLSSCLQTFEAIILKKKDLSTRMFSLLLYKQNVVNEPHLKVLMLKFLPKSAVHKYAIPPVISTLKVMANHKDLKPFAIYLMSELWKKQDRCFSYLYKLLVEPNKSASTDTGVNEVLLSQAAVIKEICISEPEKHGKEFLSTLSTIFNQSVGENTTPVACLALDGVIALCRSEIIDLRSTWKALSPRLNKDKRSLVSCRMYKLLELIPELKVKSFEYDKFMSEIVSNIWRQISSGMNCSSTLSAAYKTLSKFPHDNYVLKQLPEAAKVNLKLPPSMKATPFEMGKLPEDVLSYIPGYCYVDLLKSIDDTTVLEGYAEFLHSLAKQEVADLPRSIYSQRKHYVKPKNTNEVLMKVPAFLCSQFHERKSPALQKNLAVGVLFCYEPPLEIGKDGLPLKRSIATQYRLYEQVLNVLLNEVNIDTSEWQRCILLPNAWGGFMERCFFAYEEARRAELELQASHGHMQFTDEELKFKSKSAWLWVRDRLINLIKTNIKNTPTSHANAVFAVAGLVSALEKFYSSLEEESKVLSDESGDFVSHQIFQTEYTETLLCALDPDYKLSGKVHSWLLIHLSRPNSSASYLVKGCASASLCLLTSILTGFYANEIPPLCQFLLKSISHNSPVLSFYSALGLGLFIRSLCEAGYCDIGEMQTDLILNMGKKIMENYSMENSSNSLICLTIAVVSLSQTSIEEFKDWVSTVCNAMHEKLLEEDQSSMAFEMLGICVTAMMISATEGSCMPLQNVQNLASWFTDLRSNVQQCSGISVSCGLLIEALERFGHAQGPELKQKLLKEWFNILSSEKKPTLHRIAALNGLCSLFSHGRGLVQVKVQSSADSLLALNELIPLMFQVLSAARDTGLQNICSWEVGRLYAVHSNQQQSESSVSSSYFYLNEKSVLKPVMNLVLDGHQTDETKPKPHHLSTCLQALGAPFTRPLPPINWVTVLTPFLQGDEGNDVMEAALRLAVHQASGSTYAQNLISSYCNPPLIHSLNEKCFSILLENIPTLSLALPSAKLQIFFQTIIHGTVKNEKALKIKGQMTLKGILNSLKQSGYKQDSLKIVQNAFISITKYFMKESHRIQEHLQWVTEGFSYLPEGTVNSLLSVPKRNGNISVLTMICCYLVKTGKKPLSHLKSYIEEAKQESLEEKEVVCAYIFECFLNGAESSESDISQTEKCICWLLETIGWIKVLEDSKSKYQLMTTSDVHKFLVDICFATIIGCSGLENSYIFLPNKSLNHDLLLENIPAAMKLFEKDEWNSIVDKVIDWLLLLLKSDYLSQKEKKCIKICLCSVKGYNEFQKTEIWTDVICSIHPR
ncbi:focadhesin-like [Uloborus diversus]|uniref:focadhesin-like n=1 Tax=Uloborus diversus TaxID=327109 RepID=UPI002409F052|nr:focadhesin-like [Uloborus diversus]